MQTHYTYCHTRNDTGKVFYIGKGVKYRANATKSRNQYWKNIVKKYGYSIEILSYWESEKEALNHEKLLISCFKDMGYKLANLTDGGEGSIGWNPTIETRQKMSISRKNISDELRKKLSDVAQGEKNAFYGKTHSEETKKRMSIAAKSRKPSFLNKHHSEETKAKMAASQKARWAKVK